MQLVICVLNKTSVLESILREFGKNGINGATVLESKGMAHILSENEELKFMESIVKFLNPENSDSKTILVVAPDKQIEKIASVIDECTGGLDKPDSGVVFSVPVVHTWGFSK
ncbi:MAG: hypothetical protein J6R68_05835 [Clostridia bacterium]|nr:hypothetical protein [Clostridia bacterium]